ncbi:MAG: FAD-dependent oxidoreductase, partial [Candidatus Thorarchaeota archaeon]
MSDSETPKGLSPKRQRMMDMIIALGGMKEEQAIPLNKVNEAIEDLKKELSPLVDGIVAFPNMYSTKFLSTAKKTELVSEITNNAILKDAITNLEETVAISSTDALQGLLKSLKDTLEASESAGKEKDVFTEKLQEATSKIETDPETALYLLQQNLAITTRYGQPPCHVECPAGVRTQRFVNLTRDKRFEEALQLMRDTYPFAGTLGRVCNAPCESKCQRGLIDQPVSIRNLHRFLADNERASGKIHKPTPSIDKTEKIAIIGAGPAGIGCAYDLARMGYPVTVFEAKPQNGGLLRYGIPSYRLPRDILDEEISYVQQHGVEILNDQRITKPSELLTKGYSAVFVGTGASSSRKLRVEGEDAKGVFHALEFL